MQVRTGRLSCCRPNLQNVPNRQVRVPQPPITGVVCTVPTMVSFPTLTPSRALLHQTVAGVDINVRAVFQAQPGRVLVSADYSQIEMRLLAHLCGDPAMRALFQEQGDIYRKLAAHRYIHM